MITSAQVMTFTDDLYGAAEKAVAAGVSAEQFAKIAGWYFECARDGEPATLANFKARKEAAESAAEVEGAAARAAGVGFHDNPYRTGPSTARDWLYSAWEYGYTHGTEAK